MGLQKKAHNVKEWYPVPMDIVINTKNNFKLTLKPTQMKKSLTVLCVLMIVCLFANSQSKKDSLYYIETCQDKMTDKFYAFGSKQLLCSEDNEQGLSISVSWRYKGDGEPEYGGLTCKSYKIGACVENSTLIFLFDDDTKFKMKAWNKFNCDGNNYFDLNHKDFNEINSKKIVAIRFDNGRSFENYTYKLKGKEQQFFMEALDAKVQKRFVKGNCD